MSPKVHEHRNIEAVQMGSLGSSRETFDEAASKKVYKVVMQQPAPVKSLNQADFERLQYQNQRQQEQLQQMQKLLIKKN